VVRQGLMRDGYDGAVFHYNSKNPTIFVLRPSSQIKSVKVMKEGSQEHEDYLKATRILHKDTGLQPFIYKNDLYQAEMARGAESRAN